MNYSFVHDQEVNWQVINTPGAVEHALRELADTKQVAWDVETNGRNPWVGRQIIGHSFAWRRANGQIRTVYFPIRHCGYLGVFDQVEQLDPTTITAGLKPILEDPTRKLMGHNLQFDVHFAYQDGIQVAGRAHDTMIADKLRDENQQTYKLEACLGRSGVPHDPGWKRVIEDDLQTQAKYLKVSKSDLKEQHGYQYITVDRLGLYACQDAAYELRLGEFQTPYMGQWADVWAMEMDLFWVCVEMARKGVPIVPRVLQDLAATQQDRMAELAPRIWELAGEQFDITNDNHLRRILFGKLGYESKGQTKGGAERIDDDVLWELGTSAGCEIAKLVREHNAAEKVVSTYTHGIVAHADPHGVLHPEFDQGGAKTGRVSCRTPNLQNVPVRTELGRQIRAAFPTRPGMVRYCLDYSQIELRVMAHLSQDPLLLRIYRDGLDAHSATANEVFGTADKQDGVDMRRIAKILNFGTCFCMTEHGLMKNINKDLPKGQPPVDKPRALAFLSGFYQKYRGIDSYRNSLWYQIRRNNGLFWNIFGRPRRLPDINHPEDWIRQAAERQAISTMVQGSAADIVKHSMVAVHQYLKSQRDCESYMVLMIHDDLQFDMMPDGSAKVIREVKRLMEHTCRTKLSVPIEVDCEYFLTTWKEKQKLKF